MDKQSANDFLKDLVSCLENQEFFVEDFGKENIERLLALISEKSKNPAKKPRLMVCICGGLVVDVKANQAAKDAGVELAVVDYDVDGTGEDVMLDPQGDLLIYGLYDDPELGDGPFWEKMLSGELETAGES